MLPSKTTTAREILDKTTAFFAEKAIPTARLDAEVLLAEVLGYDRLGLYMNLDRPMDDAEIVRARQFVRRRAAREPVAYIIGRKEFAGRDFKVGPGVLVPRPDTEILAEECSRELRERFENFDEASQQIDVLEFGAGSGAVAVTLAAENHRVHLVATEISKPAAAIARENAAAHGVADRVEIFQMPDFADISGPFHAIVSNPPYVDPAEKPMLAPDVVNYEPAEAIFAEEAGLKWYKLIAAEAQRLLIPGGFIAVEISYRQRDQVEALFAKAGLRLTRSVKDYAGNDRVVMAER